MSDGYQDFGIGENDEGIGVTTERFKAEGGRKYRISLCWWNGLDKGRLDMEEKLDNGEPKSCRFTGCNRHYVQGVGYFKNNGPEWTKLAGEPARQAVGTVIVVWPTDSKGRLDKTRLAAGDFSVKAWVFSEKRYQSIVNVHDEFPLGEADIKIDCEPGGTQYQKMSLSPCKDSVLRKMRDDDRFKEQFTEIVTRTQEVVSKLKGIIAQDLTLDQIRAKLSGKGGGGGSAGASPAAQVSTQETEDLLDDLLD